MANATTHSYHRKIYAMGAFAVSRCIDNPVMWSWALLVLFRVAMEKLSCKFRSG